MILHLQNKLTTTIALSQQNKPFKNRKEVNEKFTKLGTSGKDDLKILQNLMASKKEQGGTSQLSHR